MEKQEFERVNRELEYKEKVRNKYDQTQKSRRIFLISLAILTVLSIILIVGVIIWYTGIIETLLNKDT